MNGSLLFSAIILLSHNTHYFESIDFFEYIFFITWFQVVTKQYFLSLFFCELQHRVFISFESKIFFLVFRYVKNRI